MHSWDFVCIVIQALSKLCFRDAVRKVFVDRKCYCVCLVSAGVSWDYSLYLVLQAVAVTRPQPFAVHMS